MTTITAAKETVLVIEDEPLFRIWLADTIEAAGYDVTTASTGDEGLELLKKAPHLAALVTDIDVPGSLNGISLAWKFNCRHPAAHILVISGKVLPKPEDLPPGSRFFEKPIRTETLVQALRE